MPKWRTVRVKKELLVATKRTLETGRYQDLSEFVSEAIQMRLDELKQSHEKIAKNQAEYPMVRERLLYTRDHMWAMVTPEGNVRVGLSDYAQGHLEGIAGIQTRPVGNKVMKGEPLGSVETWMFMFELHCPVTGRIVEINKVLQDEPFTINKDPPELIWIAEIEPSNLITLEEELRDLMTIARYKTWVSRFNQPRIPGI